MFEADYFSNAGKSGGEVKKLRFVTNLRPAMIGNRMMMIGNRMENQSEEYHHLTHPRGLL